MSKWNLNWGVKNNDLKLKFRTDPGLPAKVTTLTVVENGHYDAGEDAAFNPVEVAVPEPSGTVQINTNGQHDVKDYASAEVDVPNSYTAADEGKVVDNGALVAQTSRTVTSNATYDTMLNDSVTVDVPTPEITTLNAAKNGTYDAPTGTAWNNVVVTVVTEDLLGMATQLNNLFRSASNMPMELEINAPNAKTISNLFYYATSSGNPTDAKATVRFSDSATSFNSAFQACYSSYRKICLKGSTKNVTDFQNCFYLAQAIMTEDSDLIDLTSAIGANAMKAMFGYQYAISNLRFKPNTRSLSSASNNEGIFANQVGNSLNWAIVSYANSLIAANGETKNCACSGWSSKLTTIMGRVEQRTDETGTYDFFVEDETGTYSVADFITNVKGWTII